MSDGATFAVYAQPEEVHFLRNPSAQQQQQSPQPPVVSQSQPPLRINNPLPDRRRASRCQYQLIFRQCKTMNRPPREENPPPIQRPTPILADREVNSVEERKQDLLLEQGQRRVALGNATTST